MVIKKNTSRLWILSASLSLLFLISIISMWSYIVNHYTPASDQVTNLESIPRILAKYSNKSTSDPIYIPTGFFLQSFYFKDPKTIIFSGYLWQKFNHKALENNITKDIFFPDSNDRTLPKLFGKIPYADYELVGWRITGKSLYQKFDYSLYPFDKQIIRLRINSKEFYKNVILIPDLASYNSTKKSDIFGVAKDLRDSGPKIKETYFNFTDHETDTNFGIKGYPTNLSLPELNFNIVIQRNFFDVFLLTLLPIIVVWGLLFGITMTMSNNKEKADAFKFSTTGSLSALAAMFFSTLFAQIGLRSNFSGYPVLYIEYFYFITYFLIFLLALNAYLVSSNDYLPKVLAWNHNLFPKLIFWPLIFGAITLITWLDFFS